MEIGCTKLGQDVTFQVVWKRGPETSQSLSYDLNEYENDYTITNEVFSKVSGFHTSDKEQTWEEKDCYFIINQVNGGKSVKVAEHKVDMSKFANKVGVHSTVNFDSSEFQGLYLKVQWTI